MSDFLRSHELCHAGFYVLHHLPEFVQSHVHWVRDAIQSSSPLSPLLPSIFSIRVFSNELFLHIRWPKYWSFSISLSNEYSGLTSFRIDWFDLLAVQGTLQVEQNLNSGLHGSKVTADSDCSHEIKRHLLLGRKAIINLDRVLKNRYITLRQRSI